jgi:diaminopimelate decarboxylase
MSATAPMPLNSADSLPGHPHIAYKNGDLYVEHQRVADLAAQHGTPLFVYSKASMLDALAAYQRGAGLTLFLVASLTV